MKKILVHLHIYYEEYYPELRDYIRKIKPQKFDLFATMPSNFEKTMEDIKLNFPNANIDIIENRGYDVGPFVEVINKVNLDNYDYIIKIHTKRFVKDNFYLGGDFYTFGDNWRNELLSFMKDWNKLINLLESDKTIGMVGGLNVILNYKEDKTLNNSSKEIYQTIDKIPKKSNYNFIAGTMFIARASIFKKLQNKFKIQDFEEAQKNTTLAHKLERVFGMLVYYSGYRITDVNDNYKIHKIMIKILHFIYNKRITTSNKIIIKIFKIPVFVKKLQK